METTKNEMTWPKAILKVLEEERNALHYREIANLIAEKHYRINLGSTPENTVNATLSQMPEVCSTYERGKYILKKYYDDYGRNITIETAGQVMIGAFGRYWRRDVINWNVSSDKIPLLGIQSLNANAIDFREQKGIYLLHLGHEVVYVGRTIEQNLVTRLFQHTQMRDPLYNRWDSFSWFGIYEIDDKGTVLKKSKEKVELENNDLIATLEALLIEVLEPGLNKQSGDRDKLKKNEYFQYTK